jgi:hypothetical protein
VIPQGILRETNHGITISDLKRAGMGFPTCSISSVLIIDLQVTIPGIGCRETLQETQEIPYFEANTHDFPKKFQINPSLG